MNEENRNTITYDDDWKSANNYEYPVAVASDFSEDEIQSHDEQKKPKKQSNSPKQLLITIQLILCILIALAALVIKSVGGEFYAYSREIYYSELNNSAVFDSLNEFDLSDLFSSSTKDEA